MLTASALSCVRGERRLFAGLDLAVGPGEWLHVQGENGAGKTSLLRILAGLSPAAEGEIRWQGEPIRELAEDYRRHLLGVLLERTLPAALEDARATAFVPWGLLERAGTVTTAMRRHSRSSGVPCGTCGESCTLSRSISWRAANPAMRL